ncbi:MAG: aldo/keto reductase [Candidatus Sulfotelmatobacter sp.]|jgi:predicted aldo/keto reductase-like oxidoreductase
MNKQGNWNRREFIVKPILWAGAASVLAKTDLLGASPALETSALPILQRTLGKTGLSLPVVSMGVMNADVPGLLRRAYELGIRHFDTAAGYQNGRNEEMVGQVIKEMGVRDQVVISTKQPSPKRLQNAAEAKMRFVKGVEGSLKRLQMDYVDILYHHSVDSVEDAQAEGPLEALQSLKKDGKTRFIGLSTHKTVDVLSEAIRLGLFDVGLVTLNYTMAHDAGILSTIEKAARSGMGMVAMKTQAGGTVRPDAKLPKELPAASQTALLKWALNHEFVTTAIPGFSTYEHLEQDFSVARNLAYTREEELFLADKTFADQAEFCQQCGECISGCPRQVDIPVLMRSHMYAVQYRNLGMAREMLASAAPGRGLEACGACESCLATCRNTVQIGRKIAQLKAQPVSLFSGLV